MRMSHNPETDPKVKLSKLKTDNIYKRFLDAKVSGTIDKLVGDHILLALRADNKKTAYESGVSQPNKSMKNNDSCEEKK